VTHGITESSKAGAGLEALYRQQRQGLFTYAMSILGDAHLAEDVVHDVFARICELELPTDGLTAFVYRSVRNRAIDLLRRVRRQAAYEADRRAASIYDTGGSRHADPLVDAETARQVERALERLPAVQREVIVLHVHAGLTFDEVGKILGSPLSTVASYYRRGLARMRESLKGKV